MKKSGSENLKSNIKFLLIIFLIMLGKIFFESIENGLTRPFEIAVEIAAALAFSVYIVTSLTQKGFNDFSVQSIFAVVTLALTLGVVISTRLVSTDILLGVLFSSVMISVARDFRLLPVAAVCGIAMAYADNWPYFQYLAMICTPAAIGVSCVCLSSELKKSALWKKLVFAGIQLLMIASSVRVFIIYRFSIQIHHLKTQPWDSIASAVAVVILIALAICAIRFKKSIGEIFGYIAIAGFGIVPMFMDMKFVFVSAMVMLMAITVFMREELMAGQIFGKAFKKITSGMKAK